MNLWRDNTEAGVYWTHGSGPAVSGSLDLMQMHHELPHGVDTRVLPLAGSDRVESHERNAGQRGKPLKLGVTQRLQLFADVGDRGQRD